ncbi:MAG TPA: cytochrome c oxidase assembly protein, partial [Gemmatimonadales bacterium]
MLEALLVVALSLTGLAYLAGLVRLWQSAGLGHGVRRGEAAAFTAGWILLVLALVSPLHHLGATLFWAHMAQHELLMVAAAPLLVLGRPLVALVWAAPRGWRQTLAGVTTVPWFRRSWEWLSLPLVAWTIHALAIWVWHVPRLFQATLESDAVHGAQHLSFLGSALLFWWSLLQVREGRLGRPTAVIYLFTTAVHTSLLGALLTFSSEIWYPRYGASAASWGLSGLEDQQLGGLIMWIPAGLTYLAAALAVMGSWLREPKARLVLSRGGALLLLLALPVSTGCRHSSGLTREAAAQVTRGGNPERGAVALRPYGCVSCHTIPGIPGPRATVGPALGG